MKKAINLAKAGAAVLVVFLLTGIISVSCQKETTDPGVVKNRLKTECIENEFTLWAGQNIEAGYLLVWNDEVNLYIEYYITDPAQALEELHLWAGKDIDDCPQTTPGSPKVGQFPYYASATSSMPEGSELLTDPEYYAISIPLAQLAAECGETVYIAAHGAAAVETLWSAGERFVPEPGPWSTYSIYTVCCGEAK